MDKKIVIFGTGLFYTRRKHMLTNETHIVAFLDNNIDLMGKTLEGIPIYTPSHISKIEYDLIILASTVPIEMKCQLLQLKVPETKIMFWEEYVSSISHGILIKHDAEMETVGASRKKILIIVPIINYAGGFLAALYAALALKNRNYYVVIAAPIANDETVSEINKQGISVWICPSLPYIDETELEWIRKFDYVLANSLQSMICVDRLATEMPVLWWLHEHSKQYEDIVGQYGERVHISSLEKASIYCVSNLAKRNFLDFYTIKDVELLTFGIPDFYSGSSGFIKNKVVIAIVGNISKLKNQLELVSALESLPERMKNKIECWIIGRDGGKQYKEDVVKKARDFRQVKICGEFSRKEIEKALTQIDIVVCSSLEETMSITIVEGMMNKKICITNTNTGIADYINDGENGFIYKAGNQKELASKLVYIIDNFQQLNFIRDNARKTYEDFFIIDKFSKNLQEIFENKLEKGENEKIFLMDIPVC